jgi:2-hydroxy-3-oxopropionate reductase
MSTIAFIGLGIMGGPMAEHLVKAGNTVIGFEPLRVQRHCVPSSQAKDRLA